MNDGPYEQWLAECREVSPPSALADQVMSRVAALERERQDVWWLRWVQLIERSRTARWAAYSGALAVGVFPFVFLAHVAKFVAF